MGDVMVKSESFKTVRTFKIQWQAIFNYALIFILFYIFFSSAKFGFACGFGLYCAIIYFYKKPFMVLLCLIGASLIFEQTIFTIYSVILPAFLVYFAVTVLKRSDKNLTPLKLCVITVISRLTILLNGGNNNVIAGYIIEVFLSAVFLMICINAFKAPLFRGLKHKISIDELVCISALVLAFYAGLYSIEIFNGKVYLAFAAFTILTALFVYSLSFTLSYTLIIGMAVCLLSGNPAYLGVFAIYALVANIFKDTSKYLAAVSVILIDLLFAYYFDVYDNIYSYMDLISLSLGCVAFLLIPKRFLEKIGAGFGNKSERQLSRHIINRTRAELNLKLLNVSEVFYEMEKIFSGMIKGYMSPDDAVGMLSADAIEEVCNACPEKAKCHKKNLPVVENGYKTAVKAGIDKGKVTLLDIPPQLASVCVKTNGILNVCGRLSNSYRQYAIVVSNLDTSRALIGRQFKGVGDILKQLAKETKNSVGFDTKTEKIIVDELAYNNIVCSEAVVYNENNGDINISLLIKSTDSYDKSISKIISGLTGVRMIIHNREESRTPGNTVLHLKPAPKYDVIFGAAGCAKEGKSISGDTHSLTRIAEDKFLLALCDGMGSGESAEKTSSMAISMVENFYRAGFDSETILSGVNRLLNVGGEDNFATLDICAIDLSKGMCDFIKLGSPEGYIKSKNNTDIIESNALPIGILDELSPSITTKAITSGDIIVLISDGVLEAFGDREKLKEFIFSEQTINPQQLAENVLQKALDLSSGAKDDMTVLTMRVYVQL